jgi:hypothetical protein
MVSVAAWFGVEVKCCRLGLISCGSPFSSGDSNGEPQKGAKRAEYPDRIRRPPSDAIVPYSSPLTRIVTTTAATSCGVTVRVNRSGHVKNINPRTALNILALAAVCSILGVPFASAQTPPGTNGWGFVAGAESQRLFDQIRAGRKDIGPAIRLTPDSATESVLNEVSIAKDSSGRRIVGMSGQLQDNAKDMFWVVDPRTGTYRVFNLNDTNADAQKITQLLNEKLPGNSIPLERIRRHLEDARSRKANRSAQFQQRVRNRQQRAAIAEKAPAIRGVRINNSQPNFQLASARSSSSPILKTSQAACSGGGEAAIGHFDPLFIQLTDTYTWASWWYNGYGDYSIAGGGSCWANPETSVGTHWYLDVCYGELSSNPNYGFAHTENVSHNTDSLTSDYTWVDDQADVYQTDGFRGWAPA